MGLCVCCTGAQTYNTIVMGTAEKEWSRELEGKHCTFHAHKQKQYALMSLWIWIAE